MRWYVFVAWSYGNVSDIDGAGLVGLDGEVGAGSQGLLDGEREGGVGGATGESNSGGNGGVTALNLGYHLAKE